MLKHILLVPIILAFPSDQGSKITTTPVALESSQESVAPALPNSTAAALGLQAGLKEQLDALDLAARTELLARWVTLAQKQAEEVRAAESAPEGSPQRDTADAIRADLDSLLSAAEMIVDSVIDGGGDAGIERKLLAALRVEEFADLETSTVPLDRAEALELPIEVLKAQLRPLTRAQVADQLAGWLVFLQMTSLEVRNVEVSMIQAEDQDVESLSQRAVALRGERTGLIKRVQVVIDSLEDKGGDVEEARAYVGSVVVNPPITGWRAAWATSRAWLKDEEGGIAMVKSGLSALGIFVAFWFLARLLTRVAQRATRSMHGMSDLLRNFLTNSVRRLTLLVGVLIGFSMLGVNMTPLIAMIGAAGLVIGLALQGTLGNLASGLMIMVYRPFDQGDVVQVAGSLGKVRDMTLMTTEIRTPDNQTVHVPNSKIWGDVIVNMTANSTRRVDMTFGISYADDVERAKGVLMSLVGSHEKILSDPEPTIRLHALADSSVNLIVRPWVKTEDYWEVFWDVTEGVKRTFDEAGISIPFPQREVHVIQNAQTIPNEIVKAEPPSDS